jgi:hypothetical protein
MRRAPSAVAPPLAPLLFLVALPLAACLQQVSTGTGTTDPTTSGGTTAASSTGTTTPAGAGCTTDTESQITLCQQTSLCPSVSVDQGTLPGCGFRIHAGSVIDLECLCNGEMLCPIGVPDTCDQATQLLSSQTSSLVVCEEASDGRCVQVGASDAGTASAAATPSACDKQCESECAGEPDCIQLCGC